MATLVSLITVDFFSFLTEREVEGREREKERERERERREREREREEGGRERGCDSV